eukprot:14368657-Heterocapsa_arctica.AAC.2
MILLGLHLETTSNAITSAKLIGCDWRLVKVITLAFHGEMLCLLRIRASGALDLPEDLVGKVQRRFAFALGE